MTWQRRSLWAIIVVGSLHIGATLGWAAAHPPPPAPYWTPTQPTDLEPPGPLVATPAEFDLGELAQGSEEKRIFRLHNPTDRSVKLLSLDSSCGCTVAKVSTRELAPGGSATLEARFSSGMRSGAFRKKIYVRTEPYGSLTLVLRGRIVPDFIMDPTCLNFRTLELGQKVTLGAQIHANRPEASGDFGPPTSDDPQVSGVLEGRRLSVTVGPTRRGPLSGTITLPGSLPGQPSLRLRYLGEVK